MRTGTFGVSTEHRELHATARRWVDTHAPLALARSALDGDPASPPAFWDGLVERGWMGLAVSEAHGGEGFGLLEMAVVLEELGRAVVPGPFLPTVLAALVVDRHADPGAAAPILGRLIEEGRPAAVACTGGALEGVREAGGLRVRGTLSPVLAGSTAQLLVAPVATAEGEEWVILDRSQVQVTALPSLDPTRPTARIEVAGTLLGTEGRLCSGVGGEVRRLAAVLLAAEATGAMAWCVETAATYAAERHQFDRPIGQFQAVKHRCADMLCTLELSRAAAWDAARGGEAEGAALAACVAGAIVPAAAFQVAKDCIQVLGGIGYTWEHDAHLFLRRATATHQLLGGPHPWRSEVAERIRAGTRRRLAVDLPEEAESYRPSVRATVESIASAPKSEWNRRLADTGYLVPHWPAPWGVGADALHQLVIEGELAHAGIRRPDLGVGSWALPTIITHGTPAQHERFIPPTLHRELHWCQLFSEPGAGSDLASLSTRAEQVEGGWRLTGQKVWTTLAQMAHWGICLARTDPDVAKHEGITCFLVDMSSDGIDVRPLRELTGHEMFSEVFLDGVFVPDDCVVGAVGGGWSAARTTLANERVSMGSGQSFGPGVEAVLALVAADPVRAADPLTADQLGALVASGQAIAVMGLRMTLLALTGHDAGAEASIKKLLGVEHEQRVQEAGLGLLGPDGAVLEGGGATWVAGFLGNRALSIAGGTSEVQRNVIAERLLDLPKDP